MIVFDTLRKAFTIKELRNRIWFTLLAILVFRLGCRIPTPGINAAALADLMNSAGTALGFFNLVSGGALERLSIFALGITPFINASIIMQLLTYVVPQLEHMAKEEGKEGRKQLERYTRYGAVVLGAIQAVGVCLMLEQWRSRGAPIVEHPGWGFRVVAILSLTLGSAFVMWLAEEITKRGIGNGTSLLITSGIVSRLPAAALVVGQAFELDQFRPLGLLKLLSLVIISVGAVAAVVAVQEGVRKIPVQHSHRVTGRRMFGGAATHIPLRVNQGGVMPVIFASAMLSVPAFMMRLIFTNWGLKLPWNLADQLQAIALPGHWVYILAEFVLIVAFAYFYAALQMNPKELADNLRRVGAFTPGIRAGRRTAEYIDRILNRITLAGGVFLGLLALLPHLLVMLYGHGLEAIGIGGTSLLIVVGVMLDTARQLESHLLVRDYQPLLRLGTNTSL
jgi:preprotein translocase subunit SecY